MWKIRYVLLYFLLQVKDHTVVINAQKNITPPVISRRIKKLIWVLGITFAQSAGKRLGIPGL